MKVSRARKADFDARSTIRASLRLKTGAFQAFLVRILELTAWKEPCTTCLKRFRRCGSPSWLPVSFDASADASTSGVRCATAQAGLQNTAGVR